MSAAAWLQGWLGGSRAPSARELGALGARHFSEGRHAEAEAVFRQAWSLDPGYAEMPYNLALLADARGDRDTAIARLREAVALRPEFAEAHFNLAATLVEADDPGAAVDAWRAAEAHGADRHAALLGRGLAHYELEQFDAALACFESVLAEAPGNADARLGRSFVRLKRGDYAEGFADYEARFETAEIRAAHRPPPGPAWTGDDPAGRTVLVVAEQGFGDSLQFARYLPELAARGARVVFAVQPPVRPLAATLPGIEVLAFGDALPPYHCHASLLSLPHLLGTPTHIPAEVPYFHPDPKRVASWRDRLAALPGLRVGLAWAGDAHREHPTGFRVNRRRSVPLRQLAPLGEVPGVNFVSLQKNERAAEASAPDAPFPVTDWTGELGDFSDTAALVAGLDLVISVDTAVAHLAGALARPTWVLSRHGGCWRWLAGREDTPWYPTVRVFHQPARWDWDSVASRVAAELRAHAAARR